MAKREKVFVCSKVMEEEYKCGGCNWEATTAYYFSNEPEPQFDPNDPGRLKDTGQCAHCFLEMIEGQEIILK